MYTLMKPSPQSAQQRLPYSQKLPHDLWQALPITARQPLICFLSLQICPFCTFHINVIIQCVVLVTCFFHSASCFQGSTILSQIPVMHSFLWLNIIPLYGYTTLCLSIHQLWNIQVISFFFFNAIWQPSSSFFFFLRL